MNWSADLGVCAPALKSGTPVTLVQSGRADRAAASRARVSEIVTLAADLIASVLAVDRAAWSGRKVRPAALKNTRPGRHAGKVVGSSEKNVLARKGLPASRSLCKTKLAVTNIVRNGRLDCNREKSGEKNCG